MNKKWRERLWLKRAELYSVVNASLALGCFLNSRVLFEVARRRGTFEEKISKND